MKDDGNKRSAFMFEDMGAETVAYLHCWAVLDASKER